MISKGLSYGVLSARRRIREMVLPVLTTATGAFLVVLVFGMMSGIRSQSAALGHADDINRAVILIAVTVLLVGVVEVAVATTRTVAHRTRELGVLGANGIPRGPVVAALLVEPVVAAILGALLGAALAAGTGIVAALAGFAPTGVSYVGLGLGALLAVGVSIVAAVATSIVPTWNAASRPPIRSLTAGG
ncbi:FtsX-like permease family protein [Mycolicibacterium wolinskyi]|uniref:ABC transporter permease n=1 Tax=Mycolicibacterium wolinskyi TaxID=59750 RepID=A0A132PI88_9MYCO|nr:FtsX-like permease family protein [Mycolicibacterium wolinskyi]KWX22060.1 ABC transporter permease [Mycolicibacterium wolinskyi]